MSITAHPLVRLLVEAVHDFIADAMPTYAAALAYRVLFSLFPFVVFLLALLGFLHVPELFGFLREQAALLLPQQAFATVDRALGELEVPKGGVLSIGIVLALWSASAGVMAVMDAMNVAYKVKERRPAWKRFLLSLVYTVAIALMLILAAALMVVGPRVAGWIAAYVGMRDAVVVAWTWLRLPVAVLLMLLTLSLVYHAAPNVRQRFRVFSPGAVIALATWLLTSYAFGFYIAHFADHSATYGSLGAVVSLLLFFFISAAVVLFGAEVNAVLARQRGERIEAAGRTLNPHPLQGEQARREPQNEETTS